MTRWPLEHEDRAVMIEAQNILCQGCGAPLPVHAAQPTITCQYCDLTTTVPPEVLQRASAHAGRVGQAHALEQEARDNLAAHQAAADLRKAHSWSARHFVWLLCSMGIVIGCVMVASVDGAGRWLGAVVAIGAAIALVLMLRKAPISVGQVQAQAQQMYDQHRTETATVSGVSTCSECAAPLAFDAGDLTAVCPMCRYTGVAPAALGADLASQAEASAHHQQLRAEQPRRSAAREGLRYEGKWRPAPDHAFHGLLQGFATARGRQLHNADGKLTLSWLDEHWWGAAPDCLLYSHSDLSRWHVVGHCDGMPALLVVCWLAHTIPSARSILSVARRPAQTGARSQPRRARPNRQALSPANILGRCGHPAQRCRR